MNDGVIWTVTVKKAWRELIFQFGSAEEAETFAKTMRCAYVPDEGKFSVTVSAVFAENVVEEKEEAEQDA